ncbi:MAG TPA: ABC transporter substrate-binding protein [Opitutales bacterium]|nr:ABC transporter substrate-binding protein [Opitutales bacterium]
MIKILRHIWLGLALILAASSILLFSDLGHRKGSAATAKGQPRIAILQIGSASTMDETVEGMMEELRQQGWQDGGNCVIKRFNASGDYATGAAMARDIASGGYDVVLTAGTPTLQTMAKANVDGRVVHVFGCVTDPYGSGVGITGPNPDQHPPHLVGIGTFQPVAAIFETARRMNPMLKKVGTVWNPSEHNSEACVIKARAICSKLGIVLVEANASNTGEVPEALASLVSRGAEAVWIGGDIVSISAMPTIVAGSRKAGIPVFTNTPSDTELGALFSLGASYREVGHITARTACRVLAGDNPAKMKVENVVPERLAINTKLLSVFAPGWQAGDDLIARASAGLEAKQTVAVPEPGRVYKVSVMYMIPHRIFDLSLVGIREALARRGFIEGRNLQITESCASGDMSILQQLVANAQASDADLVMPLSTPCLAGSAKRITKSMVFATVTEPVGAGVGESFTKHLPNVTGAVWAAPLRKGFELMKLCFPGARRMGMLYNPGEANACTEYNLASQYCRELGIELIARAISNPAEATEAMNSLLSEKPDLFFSLSDSTVASAEPVIVEICRRNNIPVMADDESCMIDGVLLACGTNPIGNGRLGGDLAARVLLGENPATIPFTPSTESDTIVDLATAKSLGVELPTELLRNATIFRHVAARFGRPAKIAIVNMADNPALNAAQNGVEKGLSASGLVKGEDYTVRYFNAQGDFAQLAQILDAAINSAPDLIIPVGTPTTVALAARNTTIPVVWTVSSEPVSVGVDDKVKAGRLTGVYEDMPVRELLDLAMRDRPGLSKVGIIFNPGEINSRIAVETLRECCKASGIALEERAISSTGEMADAAHSLVASGVDAILTSADNLMSTSLPVVAKIASGAGIPIYADDLMLIKYGATACVGYDFSDWGIASGVMASKVLAGVPLSALPPETINHDNLRELRPEPRQAAAAPARLLRVRIVAYNVTTLAEDSFAGFVEGLKDSGLVEGRDYEMRYQNAQGDMATLTTIMQNAAADEADLVVCITTQSLQAALRQVGGRKIVFTSVADGVSAGAGKSVDEHLPNVTGITTRSPFDEMAAAIHGMMPDARRIGTLYTPAETNSIVYRDLLAKALADNGIELVSVPVTSSAEITESTQSLCSQDIAAICQIVDNTTRPGFAQIARRASEMSLPVFSFEKSQVRDGAVLAIARSYHDSGVEAGLLAARILRGADPAGIPFTNTSSMSVSVNPDALARYRLVLPANLQKALGTSTTQGK